SSPLVPYYRGILLTTRHHYEAAAEQFRIALTRRPGFTDALYNLSMALSFAGRPQESAAIRRQFERLRDYDRAVTNLQIRIGRDPSNAALWRRLLQLAEAQGDTSRISLARKRLQEIGW